MKKLKAPKSEHDALEAIATTPVEIRVKDGSYPAPEFGKQVFDRTGQTFVYHCVQRIAHGWCDLQQCLNEQQKELERLYGPFVECVNVYRHNNTKSGGFHIVAIFKCGPRPDHPFFLNDAPRIESAPAAKKLNPRFDTELL